MDYFKDNPAKAVPIAGAVLALIATYFPGIPQEAILAVVAALVGGGIYAQKQEDAKTVEAYAVVPGEVEGIERQNQLLTAILEAEKDKPMPADSETKAFASTDQHAVTWGQ
ncbi:hypothetical protein [Streptomyces sp. NPDC127112]|uniref:hypothetical protein n=1 Tax=Streptomyces sp. NPDC127112 TaxID=3345364 RepID=UPI00362E2790